MYCSIGAPLGLVGSFEGSCRPSSPNHDPPCTWNTTPSLVSCPVEFTRHTGWVGGGVVGGGVVGGGVVGGGVVGGGVVGGGVVGGGVVGGGVGLPHSTPFSRKLAGMVFVPVWVAWNPKV